MTSRYEHIRQLYFEKLAGIISVQDDARLAEWLSEDAYVREIWQELELERDALQADAFLDQIHPAAGLREVRARLTKRPSIKPQRWLGAAAVIGLLFLSVFFYVYQKTVRRVDVPVLAKAETLSVQPNTGVQLITDDGMRLRLSGQTGRVDKGKFTFHADSDELTDIHTGSDVVMSTVLVPAGATYKVRLADGSVVWINAGSSLRFPSRFVGASRDVYLEGEAYFEINSRPAQHFTVHAGETEVKVLGTSFNLRAYRGEASQTALVEGGVQVAVAQGTAVRLTPGKMATYENGTGFTTQNFEAGELLAWRQGIYYFHQLSLDQLARVMERWYGITTVFDRPALARQTVTGLMEKEDLEHFLSDLQTSMGVAYDIRNGQLHFK